jgi:heat-inducible transcriptional repressor
MNERRAIILDRVTESYITSAHPVASAVIAQQLGVSSATVRNEFAALEDEGYLQQPHTSAGRVPTVRAYARYARKLLPPGRLSRRQEQQIVTRLAQQHGEQFLEAVAAVAAELTGYAVVVTLPADDGVRATQIHLSAVSSNRVLAVVVLENGLIRQLALTLDPPPDDAVLREAESSLRRLSLPLRELPQGLTDIARRTEEALSRTLTALAEALEHASPPRRYAEGLRNLLSEPEANDPNFVRLAVEQLEHPAQAGPGDLLITLEQSLSSVGSWLPLGATGASLIIVGPSRMRYRDALTVAGGVAALVAKQSGSELN